MKQQDTPSLSDAPSAFVDRGHLRLPELQAQKIKRSIALSYSRLSQPLKAAYRQILNECWDLNPAEIAENPKLELTIPAENASSGFQQDIFLVGRYMEWVCRNRFSGKEKQYPGPFSFAALFREEKMQLREEANITMQVIRQWRDEDWLTTRPIADFVPLETSSSPLHRYSLYELTSSAAVEAEADKIKRKTSDRGEGVNFVVEQEKDIIACLGHKVRLFSLRDETDNSAADILTRLDGRKVLFAEHAQARCYNPKIEVPFSKLFPNNIFVDTKEEKLFSLVSGLGKEIFLNILCTSNPFPGYLKSLEEKGAYAFADELRKRHSIKEEGFFYAQYAQARFGALYPRTVGSFPDKLRRAEACAELIVALEEKTRPYYLNHSLVGGDRLCCPSIPYLHGKKLDDLFAQALKQAKTIEMAKELVDKSFWSLLLESGLETLEQGRVSQERCEKLKGLSVLKGFSFMAPRGPKLATSNGKNITGDILPFRPI